MSFFRPLLARRIDMSTYSVSGTPADCVAVALQDILKEAPPELVLSGINHGLNVGWDVNYSGTVGAATEAALLGYRAMAVSADLAHLATEADVRGGLKRAADFATALLPRLASLDWPRHEVLNLNHPGRAPLGIRLSECGGFGLYAPKIERLSGESLSRSDSSVYLIGGAERIRVDDARQDVTAIQDGHITLSFLQARQSATRNSERLSMLIEGLPPV